MNKSYLILSLLLLTIFPIKGQDLKPVVKNGKFTGTNESLKQYECPEWFRDAKFGIWSCWGPQAVPMRGDWYARRMYIEGHPVYKFHLEKYGHPSKFGYKDIIKLWKAEKWNPEKLMDLYVKAGAKYFVSIASHHDGFDLWNSKYNRWNAVEMGPRRDVVGEWAKAARSKGIRFGVSEHFARAYNWMSTSHGSDKEGPMAGVPYDGNDPDNFDLYFPPKIDDTGDRYPENPPTWWQEAWYRRMQDLIQSYKPDLVYSDGGFPMDTVGKKLIADYYNQNMLWHKGKLEAVYTHKKVGTNNEWGEYIEGAGIQDEEHGILPNIKKAPWQTDTSVSNWFYDVNFKTKENGTMYYSSGRIVRMLIDIVSKNGNLLLNVTQKPDGSIDDEAVRLLEEVGTFLKYNGEAIYATRPWIKCGEGPSVENISNYSSMYNFDKIKYTADDFRFTKSKNEKYLYVLGMVWPKNGNIEVKSLGTKSVKRIKSVTCLGVRKRLDWKQSNDGLKVNLPMQKPSEIAYALKIEWQ